jgi:hypothetical protein
MNIANTTAATAMVRNHTVSDDNGLDIVKGLRFIKCN